MAYSLTWSPTARFDLRDLSAYIAEDNPVAAAGFVRSIFLAIERLPVFPASGRIVPEFGEATIREIICKPCRIVYRIRPENERIEIARIWHAARGIPQI
jgi:plasmid stabilization system protein ParE